MLKKYDDHLAMDTEILSIIPARGGSKGIPKKNIKEIAGNTLIHYTIQAANESKFINRVIVSSDDDEIINTSIRLGAEAPFKRPNSLSRDDSPTIDVIQHLLKKLELIENYKPHLVVILQPTSPLRKRKHIDESLELFLNNNADSLVSVTKVAHNMNPYSVMKLNKSGTLDSFLDYDERKNIRQKKPTFYARNGAAIYISTYECIMTLNSLYGKKCIPYFMSKRDSFDLDDMVDWEIVEGLLSK